MKNISKILPILFLILSTHLSHAGLTKPLLDTNLSLSDNTTNDVSTTKHGFTPKSPNDATKYLDGTGTYTIPAGSGGTPLAYTTIGGTANAITLTPSPVIASYASAVGQRWLAIATGTNTTATVTVNINGLGALNAYQGSVVIPIGGIINGDVYWFLLDTATTVRVSPYDTVSSNGDTLNGILTGPVFNLPSTTALNNGTITMGGGNFIHAYGNVASAKNLFVGNQSGNFTLNTGLSINNVGVGDSALSSLTTGSSNIASGRYAGTSINTGAGNTLIGDQSGNFSTPITIGDYNTLIGFNSGVTSAASVNRIAIGRAAISASDNAAIIGNDVGIGSGSVRFGINMTTPTAFLHLPAGTAAVNTAPFKLTSGIDLTTPEAGVFGEYDGTTFKLTPSTIRKSIILSSTSTAGAAPTLTGFGTSPSIVANNGTYAFTINVGTGGTASTGTINLPTATTGWVCNIYDTTTPASFVTNMTGGTTSTVTVTNYSRTTGLAIAWTASDVLAVSCIAY